MWFRLVLFAQFELKADAPLPSKPSYQVSVSPQCAQSKINRFMISQRDNDSVTFLFAAKVWRRLEIFMERKGLGEIGHLPSHWDWTGDIGNLTGSGWLLVPQLAHRDHNLRPSSFKHNMKWMDDSAWPGASQIWKTVKLRCWNFSNAWLFEKLNGAAAKPFFLDYFLNIRALCKWNKEGKKKETSVFAGLGEAISRPLVCFSFAEVFLLVFYSAAVPLIPTNASLLCGR